MKMGRGRPRAVVVTGLGAVTPVGIGSRRSFEAVLAGESGIRPIRRFDVSDHSCRIAGELPIDSPEELDLGEISPKDLRRMDPGILYALAAAREALAESGLEPGPERDRVGVALGTGISGLHTLLESHKVLLSRGPRRVSPFTIPMSIANMPAGVVSIELGLAGPALCHVSACASGAHAIGEASRLIARGEADVMLAGGTEAPITDLGIAGFAAMRALSTRNDDPPAASRPFDGSRDGFVMGEGSGVLVLEAIDHARARGATLLGEIRGYGASADASHISAPLESGEGIVRCMRLALEDAEAAPEDIGHVNAHATSTPAGDPIEARALREVFGARVEQLPVSATKSCTGHLLGAAGAVEALFSLLAIERGALPPTRNLEKLDPECALDHVVGEARPASVEQVLSNSFGFGGMNASLVLGPPPA